MPLPLNQSTKRVSIGAVAPVPAAAYAVPVELNMATSGGRPTVIADPALVIPPRKRRRETRFRLPIRCDTCAPLFIREFSQANHRQYHFLEPEVGVFEFLVDAIQRGTIPWRLHPAHGIAKILLDHALLALRRCGQHLSEFTRRRKIRLRQSDDNSLGIDRQRD